MFTQKGRKIWDIFRGKKLVLAVLGELMTCLWKAVRTVLKSKKPLFQKFKSLKFIMLRLKNKQEQKTTVEKICLMCT